MNFTREPIIETIITPREGNKLVIRSSKGVGQEEYFVDSIEVVTFGHALFYRSQERPKCFLLPVTDYEVVEVRETRMVLKHALSAEKGIKIAGGREASKESGKEKIAREAAEAVSAAAQEGVEELAPKEAPAAEGRIDKKRDRRRSRRRRGKEERAEGLQEERLETEESKEIISKTEPEEGMVETGHEDAVSQQPAEKAAVMPPPAFSSLIPPPPMLISETIGRYKEMIAIKETSEEQPEAKESEDFFAMPSPRGREPLPPMFGEDHELPQDISEQDTSENALESSQDEKSETSGRLGVFSPSSILRRFRKREEEESDSKNDFEQSSDE